MIIKKIKANKIKNSRGEDAIKVEIKSDKTKAEASAPSGASTGKHEIKAFTSTPKEAADQINKNKKLIGLEINSYQDLKKIEDELSYLGGNSVIATEYAALKCIGPIWEQINPNTRKLPKPLGNVIGGGRHFKGNCTEFQEFLLLPFTSKKLDDSILANNKIHELVKKNLKKVDHNFDDQMNDEGGWVTSLTNEDTLKFLKETIKDADLKVKVKLGIDVAASSFWNGKYYIYKDKKLTQEEQIEFISELIEKYDLQYVEDPLHEEDFEGFSKLTERFRNKCMIVGDDLTTTNVERLKKAIKLKSINAVIIKPNQIGSLIKTREVINLAKENKITCIMSHRSGETLDASISQLATGFEIPIIKCGIYGKERVAKLKELKKIEQEMKLKKYDKQ